MSGRENSTGFRRRSSTGMIREGKAILDSTLGTNVRMFAPPWNQVDETHHGGLCQGRDRQRCPGYIGTPPAAGDDGSQYECRAFLQPGEIPPVDRVLELARSGSGTRFVNVFYHSRVDFPNPEAFRRVDSLLTSLRALIPRWKSSRSERLRSAMQAPQALQRVRMEHC